MREKREEREKKRKKERDSMTTRNMGEKNRKKYTRQDVKEERRRKKFKGERRNTDGKVRRQYQQDTMIGEQTK